MALMCRFQREWADVEALTCSRSLRTQVVDRDGVRVTEVGEWGRFQRTPVAPTFPWHLRRTTADVLVAHVPFPTVELGYLLARPRAKLVVRYQSDVVRQAVAMKVYAPLQMRFLKHARMILVTSPHYVDCSPVLSQLRDRCRVVPLGILPDEFAEPDPDRVRAIQERHGDEYVFFCGVHRYYKGIEYLVRAAASLDAPVVIGGDGPERVRCEALARELDAPVTFLGALSHDELVDHLHGCSAFVFPSVERSEAYGISMLEAHACGKPVVATTIGTGVEYVNLHGQTGLNVPPRDPEALAEAVNALLADPKRRRAFGETARKRVHDEFHAATIARKEFECYQEVVAE